MKQMINRITTSIVLVVLGLTIAFLIALLCGIRVYVVKSGSMEPAILTGSLCFVDTNAQYQDVENGDIIAYEAASGTLVTHRAVQVSGEGIQTKGDANEVIDTSVVTEDSFIGETLFSVPVLGYAAAFIKTRQGIIICASILTALVIAGILTDSIRPDEDDDEEPETQAD